MTVRARSAAQSSRGWWETIWSLLAVWVFMAGMLLGLHAHGALDSAISMILLTALGVVVTTTAMRAVDAPLTMNLVGWPVLASVVAFSAANAIDELGWRAGVAVAFLVLTSPWMIRSATRLGVTGQVSDVLATWRDAPTRPSEAPLKDALSQSEVDALFEGITSEFWGGRSDDNQR